MATANSQMTNDVVEVQEEIASHEQADRKQIDVKSIISNLSLDTEELLGSVTTFPTSGIAAVRTSARVIHNKLRTPLPQPEKKDTQNESSTVNQPKTPSTTKTHVKVQWINEERNFFFDALNEHGRDFEQISRFINLKMKRKMTTEKDYKTKDHIRQLYYKFFQKASKYLRFSEDVKKLPQELYTLINYGEMRRKLLMSNEKNWLKLRDLVYKGHVTIRSKGKNIKVKTPSCRALRKLNQVEVNTVEDVQLPQRIDVIFRPASMKAFGYIQTIAQNPRVRMVSLPLQKRVATLIHTLQQKWQMQNSRLHEKYVSGVIQQHGVQKIGEEIVSQSHSDKAQLKAEEPALCFKPSPDTVIYRPMVQLNELLSKTNICLNSYEDRIGAKTRGESLSSEKIAHIKDLLKHHSKRMRFDSASEKKVVKAEEVSTCKTLEETLLDQKSTESEKDLKKNEIKEEGNIEIKLLSDNQQSKGESNVASTEKDKSNKSAPSTLPAPISKSKKKDSATNGHIKPNKEPFKPLVDEEMLKKIRKGWSLSTVGDLSIGDLYLMFGSDSRLLLEYEIVGAGENNVESVSETVEDKIGKTIGSKLKNLISIANLLEGTKSLTDSNHHGDSMFKIPIGIRYDIFPRVKAPRYRQQLMRPRGHQLITEPSTNHVVRDLYQTPPVVDNQATNKDLEVTKILEEKIQGIQENAVKVVNGYSENSNSSMRSLLDKCFSANMMRKGTSISDGEYIYKS